MIRRNVIYALFCVLLHLIGATGAAALVRLDMGRMAETASGWLNALDDADGKRVAQTVECGAIRWFKRRNYC